MVNQNKSLLTCMALILVLMAVLPFFGCRANKDGIQTISSSAARDFKWEYLLYVPRKITSPYMLVIPNNTGEVSEQIETHRRAARNLIVWKKTDADELGAVLLVPVFPRPESIGHVYTHALDRDCLIIQEEKLQRLDLQLIAMIDDARTRLSERKISLSVQVLLSGYSASGMFVNRFALLHPERVRAAAVGSPGGWPILPVSTYNGKDLPYPIGISDIDRLLPGEQIDVASFCAIPQLFYMGSLDDNDASETCYFENMHEITAMDFGQTPVQRWAQAEKVYQELGANVQFKIYEGVGHDLTDDMQKDVLTFLKQYSN